MIKIKVPIVKLEMNKFQVIVDLSLYNKAVITAAIYKFSHLFYIYQLIDEINSNLINVVFESKENNIITDDIPKEFCNELIDQQMRYITNMQYGEIRDMIVKEAFKPVIPKR